MAKQTKNVLGIVGVAVATVALVLGIGTATKVANNETTKDVGAFNFQIAGISADGKIDKEDNGSLVSSYITTEGLEIDFATDYDATDEDSEKPDVTVRVHFYNEDKDYISTSDAFNVDTVVTAPEGAKFARVEATPVDDEDGISWTEFLSYANEFTVSVAK